MGQATRVKFFCGTGSSARGFADYGGTGINCSELENQKMKQIKSPKAQFSTLLVGISFFVAIHEAMFHDPEKDSDPDNTFFIIPIVILVGVEIFLITKDRKSKD